MNIYLYIYVYMYSHFSGKSTERQGSLSHVIGLHEASCSLSDKQMY